MVTPKKKSDRLRALYDELAESVLDATEAELAEEADINADADRMRTLFANTFAAFQQTTDEPRRCPNCGSFAWVYKGGAQVCADCGR